MSLNKKNNVIIVLTILVITPTILEFLFRCYTSSRYFFWGWNCSMYTFYIVNMISVIGLVFTLFYNYKTKTNSVFWYIISGLLLLAFLAQLMFVYAFPRISY